MIPPDQPVTAVCLSGGAPGADAQFGMCAGSAGHAVMHFSFADHQTEVPASEIVLLSQAQLAEADPYCLLANTVLHRRFPPRSLLVGNLLRRSWYQQVCSERVYAVGEMCDGAVQGGTAWAVTMFIQRHDGRTCAAYFYDQSAQTWLAWRERWEPVASVPPPAGLYAGIGSRKLKPAGKQAIRDLLGYVG